MYFIKELKQNKIFLWSFIFIVISYIARLFLIATTTLIDDEAHYALWTKHLPFGFFDHGPGIAFFMKSTMLIFGDNGFGVRVGGIIGMIIISIFLYLFCKKHKDINTAIIIVILFNTVPFFASFALIVTIDTPMFFFLLLAVMAYYEAIYSNKKYFYLAGALFGFALLSKEGSLLVGATIILFIVFSKERKTILCSKEFYLSFLMAFLVYSPFIIYNFQTDFTFIQYALDRQLQKQGSLKRTIELWLAQLALFSPLFFILFVYSIVSTFVNYFRKKETQNNLYFAIISLLPFIFLLQKSFKNKLEANWPLFMYAGGLFLVAFFISKNWHKKIIRYLFLANILLCNLAIFFIILNYFVPILKLNGDPINRYYKYNAIRYDLKDYYDENMDKDIRIFGLNYQVPSMLNFYLKPEIEAVCLNWGRYHPTVFDFWYDDDDFIGDDMYYVSGSKNIDTVSEYFESVEYVTNMESYRGNEEIDNFYLFLCKNYKGNNLEYIYEGNKFRF